MSLDALQTAFPQARSGVTGGRREGWMLVKRWGAASAIQTGTFGVVSSNHYELELTHGIFLEGDGDQVQNPTVDTGINHTNGKPETWWPAVGKADGFTLLFFLTFSTFSVWHLDESRWLRGRDVTCKWRRCRRRRFVPWVGKMPWSKKWQSTPVVLPGKLHGQRALEGYSPWGHKESDTAEHSFRVDAFGHQVTFETSGPQRGRKESKPTPSSALRYFESARLTTA